MPALRKTSRNKATRKKTSVKNKTSRPVQKRKTSKKKTSKRKTLKLKKRNSDYTNGGNTRGGDRVNDCRPTQYTEELGNYVLTRMIAGDSMLKIMRESVNTPHRLTVWKWTCGELGAPQDFRGKYARARKLQADSYADQVLTVSEGLDETKRQNVELALDDLPMDASQELVNKTVFAAQKRSIECSRLLADNLKWTSARMHPKSWGDKYLIAGGDEEDAPVRIDFKNASTKLLEKIAKLEREVRNA